MITIMVMFYVYFTKSVSFMKSSALLNNYYDYTEIGGNIIKI